MLQRTVDSKLCDTENIVKTQSSASRKDEVTPTQHSVDSPSICSNQNTHIDFNSNHYMSNFRVDLTNYQKQKHTPVMAFNSNVTN